MKNKPVVFIVFALMVVAQLGVPAKMIFDQEEVLSSGKEYWFETAPIDPNDPFRGKYITLNYVADRVNISAEEKWTWQEEIYLTFEANPATGFAEIKDYYREAPEGEENYLKAKVETMNRLYEDTTQQTLYIEFPFERFYMEEAKAPEAEKVYNQSRSDDSQITYAVVSIGQGSASLKNVMINGTPIGELRAEGEELKMED